jgi:hypothetical protein
MNKNTAADYGRLLLNILEFFDNGGLHPSIEVVVDNELVSGFLPPELEECVEEAWEAMRDFDPDETEESGFSIIETT